MNHNVFVNRTLNMKKIKYIGLDMDHTLIRYHSRHFEALVYELIVEELIHTKNYPAEIKALTFDFDTAIRGLVVDSKNGNILKLNRFGAIRSSFHGTKPISFQEQKNIYRSTYVDLSDPNYIAIDTSFFIAFCALYSQLIDIKETRPHDLPSYAIIASDVLGAVDTVHGNGSLKQKISANIEHFVIQDPKIVAGLKRYIHFGKKIFIITNSEYYYTKLLLEYAINPFLDNNETWQDIFEYVITLSHKPRFFYDNLPFLKIHPDNEMMTNTTGKLLPGIYQGGSANQLTKNLAINGDEILYIGDHIYGDIVRLKKDCNWRTALVVEELGAEINAQIKARPLENDISQPMEIKTSQEQNYIQLITENIESGSHKNDEAIRKLQAEIMSVDQTIAELIEKQQQFYNPHWDRVFRAGAEESFFAYQVERYACIYMEKLSDLFECSPLTYFRAIRRPLPHDLQK